MGKLHKILLPAGTVKILLGGQKKIPSSVLLISTGFFPLKSNKHEISSMVDINVYAVPKVCTDWTDVSWSGDFEEMVLWCHHLFWEMKEGGCRRVGSWGGSETSVWRKRTNSSQLSSHWWKLRRIEWFHLLENSFHILNGFPFWQTVSWYYRDLVRERWNCIPAPAHHQTGIGFVLVN